MNLLNVLHFAIPPILFPITFYFCAEVLKMDPIASAIIGAGATIAAGILGIIGVCIANGRHNRKLNDNVVKLTDCKIGVSDGELSLSNQIGVNGGAENSLSNQHKNLEMILKSDIKDGVNRAVSTSYETYNLIKTERELRQQREMLLTTDSEYKLSKAIEELSDFKRLWLEKNEMIIKLEDMNKEQANEIHRLQTEISAKDEEIRRLKSIIIENGLDVQL